MNVDVDEYTKYANRTGIGTFGGIKPGKDKFVRIMFINAAANGSGAITLDVLDNKGTWHTILSIYLANAGTVSPVLASPLPRSKMEAGGILLKDLYDNEAPYRVALNKEVVRLEVVSGSASWGVALSWREEVSVRKS